MRWNTSRFCAVLACAFVAGLLGANRVVAGGKDGAPANAQLRFQESFAGGSAWRENSLWRNARLMSPDLTPDRRRLAQFETMNLLSDSFPLLSSIRNWRDTLRGRGVAPQRSFKLAEMGETPLNLHIGLRPLPVSELAGLNGSSLPALGLSLGKHFMMGTTAPMPKINNMLRAYDDLMTDPRQPQPKVVDRSQITWLMAQPLASQKAKVDLLFVRGQRDLTPNQETNKRLVEGAVWGARTELDLVPDWKLRGEWIKSRMEAQEQDATAWQLNLSGRLRCPWGEVKANALYSDMSPGFASFMNGMTCKEGRQSSRVALVHDIKLGDVTGTASLAVGQTELHDVSQLPFGADVASDTMECSANLRWQISPKISLTARHERRDNERSMMGQSPDASFIDNHARSSNSDVGLEVKVSRALAVSVTAGQSSSEVEQRDAAGQTPFWMATSQRDENRLALSLNHRTSRGTWRLQMARKSCIGTFDINSDKETQELRFEGERQLCRWLKVKGSLLLAGEEDPLMDLVNDQSQCSLEAQLSLSKYGQLAMRYGSSDQRRIAGTIFALNEVREYGIRYNVGASGNQAGFGLAIEYSRREARAVEPMNFWRIGLTYH